MADSCVNCQTTFEKRLKGYKRQKTNQVVGEQPVYLRLSKTYGISCTPDDFLCQACFTNFQKAAKSEAAFVKSGKRKRITHLQKRQKVKTYTDTCDLQNQMTKICHKMESLEC